MIESLVERFAALEDPRCPGKVEHRLVDVRVVAVCAVVAGADTFEDLALYGRCKEGWLRGFLALPGGIPSHDTFRRVQPWCMDRPLSSREPSNVFSYLQTAWMSPS
jgi:DDE_Tnp_1-associated